MEPIISTWLIYAVDILSKLQSISIIVTIASMVVFFVVLFEDDVDKSLRNKLLKCSSIAFIICGLLALLIPDKDTMIQMIALSYITPDNIQLVQENIVDFVKRIAQAVK